MPKYAVISSKTLFDPVLNPAGRIDVPYGISLAAIEQGRIDLLKECFTTLFSRKQAADEWYKGLKKCKTWEEAEDHLLSAYLYRRVVDKTKLPDKFREGMKQLLRRMLADNLQLLMEDKRSIELQIEDIKKML